MSSSSANPQLAELLKPTAFAGCLHLFYRLKGAVEARTTNVESTTIGFMPSCTLIRRNRPTISSTASDAVSLRGIRTDVKAGVTSELTGMSSMPITDT